MSKEWREQYNEWAEAITLQLKQTMADATTMHPLLRDMMSYSLLAGGKRLRGVLLMATAAMFTNHKEDAYCFASAVEMIHTYSLIHDDLPAMDNDDYRRGNPTSHKVFGEANAILAGDALLNLAYEIMSETAWERAQAGVILPLKAMRIIAKQAGAQGMIAGQVADLENEKNLRADEKTLLYIDTHKTGALIEAAVLAGAILGDASAKEQHALLIYASQLGLAFQAMDDILDEIGVQEELGKTIGKDKEAEKLTFTTLYGIDKTKQYVHKYMERACDALAPFGDKAFVLQGIAMSQTARVK